LFKGYLDGEFFLDPLQISDMSVLDDDIVRAIGAVTSGFRVEIPLYMRVLPSSQSVHPRPDDCTPLPDSTLRIPRDISIQSLAAIILEIPDMSQLRRYEVFIVVRKKN